MERRQFLGLFGVGALASSLPVVLAACYPKQSTAPTSEASPGADGFLEVGTVAELDQEGSILNKEFELIVVRNPEDNSLVALNPECPHQGCTVNWDKSTQNLVCPCHGSKFAADGGVVKEPATKPLANYVVKEENGSIFVKVA